MTTITWARTTFTWPVRSLPYVVPPDFCCAISDERMRLSMNGCNCLATILDRMVLLVEWRFRISMNWIKPWNAKKWSRAAACRRLCSLVGLGPSVSIHLSIAKPNAKSINSPVAGSKVFMVRIQMCSSKPSTRICLGYRLESRILLLWISEQIQPPCLHKETRSRLWGVGSTMSTQDMFLKLVMKGARDAQTNANFTRTNTQHCTFLLKALRVVDFSLCCAQSLMWVMCVFSTRRCPSLLTIWWNAMRV